MEDKTFELLEKMYSDFSSRFGRMESDISAIKNDVQSLKYDVVRLENDLGKKTDAALDGYHQVYEKLQEHDQRFDNLENKLQKQDVEIRVIKGA